MAHEGLNRREHSHTHTIRYKALIAHEPHGYEKGGYGALSVPPLGGLDEALQATYGLPLTPFSGE